MSGYANKLAEKRLVRTRASRQKGKYRALQKAKRQAENELLSKQLADVPSTKEKAKVTPRRRWPYFAGAAAVICFAVLLANFLTLSLEIPEGGVVGVVILHGNQADAQDFLSDYAQTNGINAQFSYPDILDFSAEGRQDVALTLRSGRRVAETTAPLYVLSPLPYIMAEAGTPSYHIFPHDFIPMAFMVNTDMDVDLAIIGGISQQDTLEVGSRTVTLEINGAYFNSVLDVVDTTPPTATLADVSIPMGQVVYVDDFVVDMFDISPIVRVEFEYEPYMFQPGAQAVFITFEDYFGNQATYTANLFIYPNTVPPVIYGTQDMNAQLGSPVLFRRGVSAFDAFGRPLDFDVDSDVNVNELGVYEVTYTATDAWGLSTSVTHTVTVLEVDPAHVRELADNILAGILRDDMTQVQEARAIFDWISNNIHYAGNISRGNVYEGAYQAIRNRRGDCFVFYSISEVLLTQAGIPNMHIARIPGTPTRHSWNLINPDELGWHHFDATHMRVVDGRRLNRFMFTSSDALRHTQLVRNYWGMRDFYTYDPSLYPEIVQ